MTTLLHAKNLSLFKHGKAVLQNVSLEIKARDFITVIGPNGAGKSLLLKCLMGILQASEGSITAAADLKVGYVPQNFNPDPTIPITVKHFLLLGNKVSSETLHTIAAETNISSLLDRQLHELSGGERQRVLLGRALAKQPNMLVLDEPAQNLDIAGQLAFYQLLEDLYEKHPISILMVSHELHLVMACSKQVVCLYHHICCSGAPQAVIKDPEFIKLFGADMASHMAVYHHEHDHSHEHTHDDNCQHHTHKTPEAG